MKFLAFTFLILCVATFMLIEEIQSNKESGLMKILQSVLDDPDFLALDKSKQLEVLIATYQLLLKYHNRGQSFKQDYFSS